ncbi:hypothetical protein ACE1TF_03420 [Geomicrobium sp. JSM 1781026]|uniref:hypothetical protein n=1 Tax=Geomicrobium sp. JSM 1781026 TaxID=3344580 RepID=UPI0035C04BAF
MSKVSTVRRAKRGAIGAMTFVLGVGSSLAFANQGNAQAINAEEPTFTDEELQQIQADADAIEPFIENENGVLYFDEESAIDAGVDEVLVSETSTDIDNANAVQDSVAIDRSVGVQQTCNGRGDGLVQAEWGQYVYMDSCDADTFSNLLVGGASIATIAGAFSFSVPTVVAGGLAGLGAAVVSQANVGNTGIRIHMTPSAAVFWIGGQ